MGIRAALAVWIGGSLGLGGLAGGAGPAGAQELLLNTHFHVDTSSWVVEAGGSFNWSSIGDPGSCDNSGIGFLLSEPVGDEEVAEISQCFPAGGGVALFAALSHRGYGTFTLGLRQYAAAGCAGGALADSFASGPQDLASWQNWTLAIVTVPGVNSAELYARATHDVPHALQVDEIHATLRRLLFADDIDGNLTGETVPCRWSSVSP